MQEIVGELGRVVRQMAAVADRCLTVLIELLTMVAFATSLPPTVPLPAATRRRLFIKCNSSCSSSSSKPEHRTLIAGRPAGTVPCRAVPCRARRRRSSRGQVRLYLVGLVCEELFAALVAVSISGADSLARSLPQTGFICSSCCC